MRQPVMPTTLLQAVFADTLRRLGGGDPDRVAGALRGAEVAILDWAGLSLSAAIAHPVYPAPFALIGKGSGRTLLAASDAGRRT